MSKKIIFPFILAIAGGICFYLNGHMEVSFAVAIVLFIIGLFLLIKGGDWFVDGASKIAEKFHVPEVLIGATVVSIGTTLPEVLVSSQAALKGNSGISYGNAIGSIICNVSLIAAITMAIKPSKVEKKPLYVPLAFFFVAAIFYSFNAYAFQGFSRVSGVILLIIFLTYMVIVVKQALKSSKASASEEDKSKDENKDKEEPIVSSILLLILGAFIIASGATLLVDNGTIIASQLGVPETVIAITFVALGTSLPELVTAITSLAKGHGALSLGNIIGANLFNLVAVSGLAITLRPYQFSKDFFTVMNLGGKEVYSSLVVDTPLMFVVMLVMALPPLIKGKLYRWQGVLLLGIYFAFTVFQFIG